MHSISNGVRIAACVALMSLAFGPRAVSAQAGETFTATASVKAPAGERSAPITVVVTRYTTDAERNKAVDALKKGGTTGLRDALAKAPDLGHIEVAQRKTPIKYAFQRSVGSGRIVTLVADHPIAYLGADLPDAKPKTGYDLALILLDLSNPANGVGELAPAAKVKINEGGAIATEDYGAEVVRLTSVQPKR